MSIEDETAPVEEDVAPVVEDAAPGDAEVPASPPEGYIDQSRYDELRKEFNQRNNLIDRAKAGDNDALRELIGAEFAQADEYDPEQETEEQDDAPRDPRVDALIQERQQEREAAIVNDVSTHIDTLLDEAKVDVPKRFKQAILQDAWMRGGGAQIQPGTTEEVVKEWVDEYKQLERAAGDRYVKSKKDAPHVSPGGTGATEVIDPLDGNARRQRIIDKLNAAGA